MDWPTVVAMAIVAFTFLLILGGFEYIFDNPRRMGEQREHGYDSAIREIREHNTYWDREKQKTVYLKIMVDDGKVTPEWAAQYLEWFCKGEDCAIESFVQAGVMNKRTGEKFKRRFRENAEEAVIQKKEGKIE